jgi:hypothetical protein
MIPDKTYNFEYIQDLILRGNEAHAPDAPAAAIVVDESRLAHSREWLNMCVQRLMRTHYVVFSLLHEGHIFKEEHEESW